MRVAVLDDDRVHLELARQTLEGTGHDFHGFTDGRTLLRALRRESFDLLILDWELPDISGIEVMRWARENLEEPVPILFVTNRSAESDVIEGLSAGADDFMVKPIRVGELTARIGALLRRAYPNKNSGEFEIDRYRFDPATVQIHIGEQAVVLKQKEFDLAVFLFRNIGRAAVPQASPRGGMGHRSRGLVALSGHPHFPAARQARAHARQRLPALRDLQRRLPPRGGEPVRGGVGRRLRRRRTLRCLNRQLNCLLGARAAATPQPARC